jgi:PAS domain S-box-containing protein
LRILHLEDDRYDAELIQATLESEGVGCDVTRTDTEAEFSRCLEQGQFDLILADYTLPSFDGIAALRIAQQVSPHVPFIFVTGTLGEEVAIEALKLGATDYVFKTGLSRLVPSVHRALREAEEKVQRKCAEEELQQLVDFVPHIIVVLGPDGTLIHANRFALEYTGLTSDQYRSMDVVPTFIHPDDADRMRAVRDSGFRGKDPFELETRIRGKDGIYRWFLIRYNPLVEQGRVKRWYASSMEIESRKQKEELVRQENVRLEERTRIAEELHDTLLQTFMSASMQLGAVVQGLPSGSTVKPKLDRTLQLMERGINEARNTLEGLRSPDARVLDLALALASVQHELAIEPDTDFRINVNGQEQQLWPLIRHEIYRIGREALVNAFNHSRAKCIEFELEYAENDLRMRVRDNGRGIEADVLKSGRKGHWGLAGMRERAARIGGLLEVFSTVNAGTEVQFSIPADIAFQLAAAEHTR